MTNQMGELFVTVARKCCHAWGDPAIFLGSCTITSGGTFGVQILDTTESEYGFGAMVLSATNAELMLRSPESVRQLAVVRARNVRSLLLENRAINLAVAEPAASAEPVATSH